MNDTPTPRTDFVAECGAKIRTPEGRVDWEFRFEHMRGHARDIESELAELTAEVEAWRNKPLAEQLRTQTRECTKLRTQLAWMALERDDHREAYNTLAKLLNERFPVKDGVQPAFAVEDVLRENESLRDENAAHLAARAGTAALKCRVAELNLELEKMTAERDAAIQRGDALARQLASCHNAMIEIPSAIHAELDAAKGERDQLENDMKLNAAMLDAARSALREAMTYCCPESGPIGLRHGCAVRSVVWLRWTAALGDEKRKEPL